MARAPDFLQINEDDIKKLRKMYGKSDSDVMRDITILKEWLKQQPHLPDDEEEGRLERLLFTNKCHLEVTKTKLENCYTFRTMYPDVMKYYDVSSDISKEAMRHYIVAPLPRLTENLERVIYIKPLPKSNSKAEYFYSLLLFLELLKTYDISSGFIYIFDCAEITFDFLLLFDFQFLQNIANFTVNSLSGKFSKIIIYKMPGFADMFFKILKLVLKPKLFERISLHQNLDTIHQTLPMDYLPIEFEGNNGSIHKLHEQCREILIEHNDFFKKLSKRRSNEELRVGDMKANEMFGTDGSFKKLNLD